jgi:orotidine-5'-phosphate decarboxylase
MTPSLAKEKIIAALDVADAASAEPLLRTFSGRLDWIKIGLQLYTAEGPAIVARARDRGFRIFLDLKLHDIPNTVAHAVASAGKLGVDLLTIHTLGGPAMMRAAADAAGEHGLGLLGVTLLTSMDAAECDAVGLPTDVARQVERLGVLAQSCGLAGAVASPLETALLRQATGPNFLLVVPGIRPTGAALGDQKRVMTPAQALTAGASYLVIGRPLTAAPDPLEALTRLDAELATT